MAWRTTSGGARTPPPPRGRRSPGSTASSGRPTPRSPTSAWRAAPACPAGLTRRRRASRGPDPAAGPNPSIEGHPRAPDGHSLTGPVRQTATRWWAGAALVGATLLVPGLAPGAAGDRPGLVAFVRGGQIWTVPSEGGAPGPLTAGARHVDPAWSPDGTRLAMAVDVGGQFD